MVLPSSYHTNVGLHCVVLACLRPLSVFVSARRTCERKLTQWRVLTHHCFLSLQIGCVSNDLFDTSSYERVNESEFVTQSRPVFQLNAISNRDSRSFLACSTCHVMFALACPLLNGSMFSCNDFYFCFLAKKRAGIFRFVSGIDMHIVVVWQQCVAAHWNYLTGYPD
mgnify:CR=1 FL=1